LKTRPGHNWLLGNRSPVRTDSESIRDEKVEVLKAISPVSEKDVIRGQFRGYRTEKGVAPDSKVETFAALRLEINSWRWQSYGQKLVTA
jgi:glucose-6-phosphate 1-dehydrogenase